VTQARVPALDPALDVDGGDEDEVVSKCQREVEGDEDEMVSKWQREVEGEEDEGARKWHEGVGDREDEVVDERLIWLASSLPIAEQND